MTDHLFRPIRPFMPQFVETAAAPIQCSARVHLTPANPECYYKHRRKHEAKGFDINRCVKSAVVALNGEPLCALHAGRVVLAMLANGELVQADGTPAIEPPPLGPEPIEATVNITRRLSNGA